VIYRQFDDLQRAEQAIAMLQAAGVADLNLSLIAAASQHDAHAERTGSFADGDGHEEHAGRTGSFADGDGHEEHAGRTGSFADGDGHEEHTGRIGSFADGDRETVTSFSAGRYVINATNHARIRALLQAAGVARAEAEAQIAALHQGKAIVLLQAEDDISEQANTLLASV
jgi:hypothetical protein